MKRRVLIVILAFPALCLFLALALTEPPSTLDADDLSALEIFAYRDWQSVGIEVRQGDVLTIRARGEWLYTPGEWNGPAGHPRYRAPSYYPIPGVAGGALIGKIGEKGRPFYVGEIYSTRTREAGQVYLRIDDDILSDNEGKLEVDVRVGR